MTVSIVKNTNQVRPQEKIIEDALLAAYHNKIKIFSYDIQTSKVRLSPNVVRLILSYGVHRKKFKVVNLLNVNEENSSIEYYLKVYNSKQQIENFDAVNFYHLKIKNQARYRLIEGKMLSSVFMKFLTESSLLNRLVSEAQKRANILLKYICPWDINLGINEPETLRSIFEGAGLNVHKSYNYASELDYRISLSLQRFNLKELIADGIVHTRPNNYLEVVPGRHFDFIDAIGAKLFEKEKIMTATILLPKSEAIVAQAWTRGSIVNSSMFCQAIGESSIDEAGSYEKAVQTAKTRAYMRVLKFAYPSILIFMSKQHKT